MEKDGMDNGQVTQEWRDGHGKGVVKAALIAGSTISTLTGIAAWYWTQLSAFARWEIIQWLKGL